MACGSSLSSVVCPYHPESPLEEDYTAGDLICKKCGLVVGDRVIGVGFKDKDRVGAGEEKMSTFIEAVTTKPGSEAPAATYKQQRKGQEGPEGASDSRLTTGFEEIANMADRLNLPKVVVDCCKALFKQVHQEKLLRGRASDAVAAACLLKACRKEEVPCTFKDICSVSRHSKKEINRCSSLISRSVSIAVKPVNSSDSMSRYYTSLQLPSSVQKAARHIAETAKELDLSSGSYLSVAAAAIYMASQASECKKSHREVGDVVGVADSTVRRHYRLLYEERQHLFPADFEFATPLDQLPKH